MYILSKKGEYVNLLRLMSQDRLVKIKCQETGDIRYTRRNKKTSDKKLELKKYSSVLRKHTVWKELKK